MPTLPDFRLAAHLARWEFSARHHLSASDVEPLTMAELLDLADDDGRARWASLSLGYTETAGLPVLREAIAATYDGVTADDIVCFAGAEEALYLAMQVLLEPGDHAVGVTPDYQAAETVPLSVCAVTGVALRAEHGWALDVDAVERALRRTTRLVSVNFPNNPTGAVPDETTWRRLVRLCERRAIHLVSDEVQRGLSDTALPQAVDLADSALSVNGLSKAYGLPGLRIGWIACRDRALLGMLARAKHYTSLCNSGPSEALALIALRARDRVLARNRRIVADNLPVFDAFFARYPDLFEWAPPQGGTVCFPRYLGQDGVEAMCAELVAQQGVLLLPASVFRSALTATPADRFRLGVGRRDPREALDLWATWLDKRR
ncbi:aminotransferase class I/II-fold pyridoxal phosphate-dependent enzyme [Actinokineospora sp.]|uniref:aminotransferase class I/II-fold pyridoxal phosphate-dependent enzyme n=1 Tax=Actinokineospora sp. TaxID=1872133 RepID=UPI0040383A4A